MLNSEYFLFCSLFFVQGSPKSSSSALESAETLPSYRHRRRPMMNIQPRKVSYKLAALTLASYAVALFAQVVTQYGV